MGKLQHPAKYLEKIKYLQINTESNSNEYSDQLRELEKKLNLYTSERRNLQIKLSDIISSVDYAKQYEKDTEKTSTLAETSLHLSKCPFCQSKHENLVNEANSIEEAINWLNTELSKTPYLIDSFLSEKTQVETQIKKNNQEIIKIQQNISKIKKINEELAKNKSLDEQGLKVKLKIETILEDKIDSNSSELEKEIEGKKKKIISLNKELKEKFNPERKMKEAEEYINIAMNQIAEKLDFEKTYKPINLKFSLTSFELWHEKSDGKKVFLRSMGSGANWLYCHLALFTALHKYFCFLGNQCLIPPILFLDQPSQVYFPTSIEDNNTEEFNAHELKEREGNTEKLDEDMIAVTNFYDQLVAFCKLTLEETGIEPQIIITDHADKLNLKEVKFDELVEDRRWRKRGFIEE